ncbi:MAG: 3'-5' exonuclease [Alkalicoccus sp.]|nr:MAG: 3'-5' exonuclease [Alkalicoccus sp.]
MRMIDLWKQQLGGSTYPAKGRRDAEAIAYARRLQRDRKQMEHLTLPLTDLPVAAFDLETTGFSPGKGDIILSIGAVTINRGKTEEFYSLIYSDKTPPEHITELTGITGEQLKEAPSAEHVVKDFLYFIEGRTLAAHHASHERRFMEKILWDLFRMKFNYRLLDTSYMAALLSPDKPLYTLEECCGHFNIPLAERHHALEDAKAAAELWKTCTEKFEEENCLSLKDVYTKLAQKRHGTLY